MRSCPGVSAGVGTVRQPLLPCRCFACALLPGARPCLGFRGRSLPSVLMLARPAAQTRVPCVPVPSRVTRIPAALLPGLFLQSDVFVYIHMFISLNIHTSVQFHSVTQSCPTLCNPMNHSTPGLPIHHQLPEFTQTHVHQVGDASLNAC